MNNDLKTVVRGVLFRPNRSTSDLSNCGLLFEMICGETTVEAVGETELWYEINEERIIRLLWTFVEATSFSSCRDPLFLHTLLELLLRPFSILSVSLSLFKS